MRVLQLQAQRAWLPRLLPTVLAPRLQSASHRCRFQSNGREEQHAPRFNPPQGAAEGFPPSQPSAPQQQQPEEPQSDNKSGMPWVALCVPAALAVLAIKGGASPASLASDFWSFYLRMLVDYPFPSRIATGMTGMFLGDLLAQILPSVLGRLRKPDPNSPPPTFKYDVLRASRLVMFSALCSTPVAYYWYNFLDAMVNPANPTAISTVATKVALDQLLLTPIMTCAFFMAMCTMEGRAYAAIEAVRTKLIPTLKANYLLWPAAHCINFACIPGDQRILYINCVAVIWTVVLSTAAAAPVASASTTAASGNDGDTSFQEPVVSAVPVPVEANVVPMSVSKNSQR